jgi:hypothetical protein
MKKYLETKNIIITILIILLLLVSFDPFGVMPKRTKTVEKIVKVEGQTLHPVEDSVAEDEIVEEHICPENIVEVEVEVEKKVPVYQVIDTAEILKVYYAKSIQKDVLTLPNNIGTLTLIDTITQNKVVGRSFDSKVKKQIVRDTVRVPESPKNLLYFGVEGNVDRPDLISNIGFGVMYKTKSDKIYKVSMGVNNRVVNGTTSGTFTPYIGGGVYWKINLKKP